MNPFKRESAWDKAVKPIRNADSGKVVKSVVTTGASMIALSVASAAASAVRRRQERP